jgi:predicted nucleotidyltransferase
MTTGLDAYKKSMMNNDFHTFQMNLSSAFHTTIRDIYKEMGFEEPSNQVNKMYADVVSNTIKRIQDENHPFSVGLNVKQGIGYEIVFLKKKIEPVF